MMNKTGKVMAAAALAGVFSLPLLPGTVTSAQAMEAGMEKCYGVARAGANDCGTQQHSCAGMAEKDGDAAEWIAVPAGLCEKLAGGRAEGMVSQADTMHDHEHEAEEMMGHHDHGDHDHDD